MSKSRSLSHDEREKLKEDYLQAYRLALGREGYIEYRRGWWYLSQNSVTAPYSAKEIVALTQGLRKRIPPRGDSEEDSFQ